MVSGAGVRDGSLYVEVGFGLSMRFPDFRGYGRF